METSMNIVYSPLLRWLGKKRGKMGTLFIIVALLYAFFGKTPPVDYFSVWGHPKALLCWALLLLGVWFRIWSAGYVKKDQEVTSIGPYCLVRHPLYFGSLLIYLSFFLALGDAVVGVMLFMLLFLTVYWPRMFQEEEGLVQMFGRQYHEYMKEVPRIVPNPFRIRPAVFKPGFTFTRSYHNLGLRALWMLALVPAFFKLLEMYKSAQ